MLRCQKKSVVALEMKSTVDMSERQDKALRHYENQKAVWDRIQSNLAKKVNRHDPSETLPGCIHHQRLRNEELGILDAAVPASVRNGSNAWEMSLRGGDGGVRYVQIGKAYPYPLYCPIRDSDLVDENSNAMMRMIPMDKVPPRNKPASETEYFHDRQQQFRNFVKKKFSHFQNQQEPLIVSGVKAPQAQEPIVENNDVEPVVFVPFNSPSNAHPVPLYVTEEPKSRPLSAVTVGGVVSQSASAAPAQQRGPMLCFSTAHVSFNAAPGETVQGSVVVDNIGTTAVYYSWAVVSQPSIVPEERPGDFFFLSDPAGGVMLPEDQKIFTFTVRAPTPGVFTKQYELLTVPAGKERIVVYLRAVVIENERNDVGTARISRELDTKAVRDYQRQMLTDATWNPNNLVLDHANIDIELRNLTLAKAKKLAEIEGVGEFQEGVWQDANAALGLPYNQAVYSKIMSLHRSFHAFLATVGSDSKSHSSTSKEWDGSIKSLMEDFTLLKDIASRNTFLAALNTLLRCAKVSEDKSESLHTLVSRAAGRQAFGNAIDEMHRYTAVARDLAEGKAAKAKTEKVEVKGAKAPPPKAAKPAKGAPPPTVSPQGDAKADAAVSDAKHPNFDKYFVAGVRRIVGDAIESIFASADSTAELIALVTDRPFECGVRKKLDAIAACQSAADAEVDITPENAKQKKK